MDGPVSSVASAVADAAGDLKRIPVIGVFARATEIGARAAGAIASLFGFSKPAEIKDAVIVRNTPFASMATSDGADTTTKLTVTRKQEICVDPRTAGDPVLEDQLSITHLAGIESWLTSFDWNPSDDTNKWLFTMPVTPGLRRKTTNIQQNTPMSYLAWMFREWSGSIKVRFVIPAAKFSQGKIAIVYDPHDFAGTTSDTYNTNYTEIVDISETRDFEVIIPWQQKEPYKICSHFFNDQWKFDGTAYLAEANGTIGVRVLNTLVQPDDASYLNIQVFVSACDDIEFVNPSNWNHNNIYFTDEIVLTGSGEKVYLVSESNVVEHGSSATDEQPPEEDAPTFEGVSTTLGTSPSVTHLKSSVFYGERVGSLRQLVKRYCPERTFYFDVAGTADSAFKVSWSQMPFWYKPAAKGTGIDGVHGTVVATSYLSMVVPMFAGWRGGIRRKIMCNDAATTMRVGRYAEPGGDYGVQTEYPMLSTSYQSTQAEMFNSLSSFSTGGALTNDNMRALEFEIPYAQSFRFSLSRQQDNANSFGNYRPLGNKFDLCTNVKGEQNAYLSCFVAAADDFQVFGFTGVPPFEQIT
jgi:hypothetical protein